MYKAAVIVIDDELNILKTLEISLQSQNFYTEVYSNPLEALKAFSKRYFDIAYVDLKMIPINGIEVLKEIKKNSPDTTVVMMTAYGSVETAVEAIKSGAYDYISKPFVHKEFIYFADRIYNYHSLNKEIKGLKFQIETLNDFGDIVTNNPNMVSLLNTASVIAESDLSVLIEGESGTGKEMFARYIHSCSERKNKPFVAINCAAIPESLFESELFGHVRGSFTGAIKDRIGRFEMADSGTVFLDEVAELPKAMQVKLLRFLQNMEYERVGENITRKINLRVISATNKDIDKEIKEGSFREDFFYRIASFRMKLPPLRERKDDISILAEQFILKYKKARHLRMHPGTLESLKKYDWPGNVREFENVIRLITVLAKDNILIPDYLPAEIKEMSFSEISEQFKSLEELELDYIKKVLEEIPNAKQAAEILGISETTLWRKRKLYNI